MFICCSFQGPEGPLGRVVRIHFLPSIHLTPPSWCNVWDHMTGDTLLTVFQSVKQIILFYIGWLFLHIRHFRRLYILVLQNKNNSRWDQTNVPKSSHDTTHYTTDLNGLKTMFILHEKLKHFSDYLSYCWK